MGDTSTITSLSLGRGREDRAPSARAQLVLLAVSDDLGVPSSRHLLDGPDGVDEVRFGRGPRDAIRRVIDGRRVLQLRVPDPRMSTAHGRLVHGHGGWVLDDPDSKNGAVVDGTVMRRTILTDGAVLELGHTFFLFRLAPVEESAPADVREDELSPTAPTLATFVGPLADSFASLARVARAAVSVVLLGETGTGKEVVARALHALSDRPGPFVAVNCGALPPTLIEAELFGHRRGAFSGAVADRPGLVRSADHGTLFLDEVGELPAASQTAFLRVLQESEVVPVGDVKPIKVDTRLCAATLRDLDELVERGSFRRDLYARLFGWTLELPPLRERRADLGLLLRALLARLPGGDRVRFSPSAMRAIFRHAWPLNVRELEKALTSAVALSADGLIELSHLPAALARDPARAATSPPVAAAAAPPSASPDGSDDAEPDLPSSDEELALRAQLVALLTVHEGNVVAVSDALGKRRMQVYRWVKRFGLRLEDYRR